MVLLDRFSLAGSFNIITVVTIRINHIYPMTRVMTPESPEICAMRHIYKKQNHKLTFKRSKVKADRRYTVEVDYDQDIMDDPIQCLLHINVKLDKHQRLDPTVIRQLKSDGFEHHQLDITYGVYQKKY